MGSHGFTCHPHEPYLPLLINYYFVLSCGIFKQIFIRIYYLFAKTLLILWNSAKITQKLCTAFIYISDRVLNRDAFLTCRSSVSLHRKRKYLFQFFFQREPHGNGNGQPAVLEREWEFYDGIGRQENQKPIPTDGSPENTRPAKWRTK